MKGWKGRWKGRRANGRADGRVKGQKGMGWSQPALIKSIGIYYIRFSNL
jgi:hypothetical protein